MNRRVLLVDVDHEFQDTLTKLLGRYRVIVMTETDTERALALGQADPPDLAIIAVEEPDKAGFKAFQKFRKVLPSTMPIMLVTGSLSGDAFTKHKSLKVHANAYLDKRSLSEDELVAKIDNLIGLGDLQEDDISIPVEDDIPVEIAEGDVVLDEQLDDDPHGSFEHEMATVGPNNEILADVLDAETDAAFASLLGGDEEAPKPAKRPLPGVAPHEYRKARASVAPPAAEPVPEPVGEAEAEPIPEPVPEAIPDAVEAIPDAVEAIAEEDSGIPEPVPHKIPDDAPESDAVPRDQLLDMQSVPARIDDGGRQSDLYAPVSDDEDFGVEETAHSDGEAAPAAMATTELESDIAEEEVAPADPGNVSLSSIPIVDDELVSLDDEIQVETEEPEPEPEPVPTLAAVPAVSEAPVNPTPARAGRQTGHPMVDLGLDDVAKRAETEQSGVHDRKAIRKIDELERQITQLKTELDRARATADSAAKGGREAQFLNLREQSLAKDKELKGLKASNEQHAKDLAEAQEKLRQAQHAKQTLEAKNSQLEERLLDDGGKVKDVSAQLDAIKSKAAQLEADLDAKTRAATAAETALAQAERDLAKERANRAASASEAEKTLRSEREQIVQRHKGELAALRAESEAAQEHALVRLREELDAAHGSKLEAAIEEVRRANAAEHGEAVEAIEAQHNKQLVELKANQAGELSRFNTKSQELEAALAEARSGAAAAIAAARDAQDEELEGLKSEHGAHVDQLTQQHSAQLEEHQRNTAAQVNEVKREAATQVEQLGHQIDELTQQLEQARHDAANQVEATKRDAAGSIEQARREAAAEIAQLKREAAMQLEQLQQQHAAAIDVLHDEHAEVIERNAESHGQTLAQVKSEHDAARRQAEAHVADLHSKHEAARQEAEAQVAELHSKHEDERAQFADAAKRTAESHRVAIAELHSKHEAAREEAEAQVAELHSKHEDERAQFADAAKQTAESHRVAIAELHSKHEAERAQFADAAKRTAESHRVALADHQQSSEAQLREMEEAAQREVAEARAATHAAKTAADEAAARAQAEREDLLQAHASALGELGAKHDRAIAIANGETVKAKAVADAERAKEVAALKAEHERVIGELNRERDELQRGLSSTRDGLKRAEAEHASAVQTIADRNADLRAHQQAIAERDQRITELRGEIESLEGENANYQDQVLRAYQKIKSDEAMVARARKAMAIALTVLDDQGNPTDKPPTS